MAKSQNGEVEAPAETEASAAPPAASSSSAAPADGNGAGAEEPEDGLLLVGGKPGLYHCNYCMRDISTTVRIKCAECKDWDSCVDCFCAGAELSGHKAYHPYRVVDNTNFPLFHPDWTATEELNMLSAMEAHGMGNFGKVSEYLGTEKKPEKVCMEHYIDTYLHAFGTILPENTFVKGGESVPTASLIPEAEKDKYSMKELSLEACPEAEYLRHAPPLPADGTKCPREKFRSTRPTERDRLAGPEATALVPGYMPLRGDFDVEHDNEAELLLADMELDPEADDPAELQLKLDVIDVYNRKLDERERRKEFAKTHGLIDYRSLQNKEKRKPKDERELMAKLRIFTRFQTQEEHEQLMQGVLEAKRMRKRIEQLQQYRRMGIRNQAEVAAYEADKRKRETEQQMKRQSASYLLEAGGGSKGGSRDRLQRYRKRNREDGDDKDQVGSADGPPALDVESLPGADQLSAKEKQLCGVLRLLPKVYLKIKARLIHESNKRGFLEPDAARQLASAEVSKVGRVYDFLVSCKWVNPSARPELRLSDITARVMNNNDQQHDLPTANEGPATGHQRPKGKATTAAAGGGGKAAQEEEEEQEEEDASMLKHIDPPTGVFREMSVDDDTPDDHEQHAMASDPLFSATDSTTDQQQQQEAAEPMQVDPPSQV